MRGSSSNLLVPADKRVSVTSRRASPPWISESGSIVINMDELRHRVLLVDSDRERAARVHAWLSKRYECIVMDAAQAAEDLATNTTRRANAVVAEFDKATTEALLRREQPRAVPVILIVTDPGIVPQEKLFAVADYLTLPLIEGTVMQRVQMVLTLRDSEERNAAYRRHHQLNLEEMIRLRRLADEKERSAQEAVAALEAPIVTVTHALVKVLSEPELKNSHVRQSLESILSLMTRDVYRPAMERVMKSELDPVAMSLLQSYFHSSQAGAIQGATPPRKLSRKPSHNVFSELDGGVMDVTATGLDSLEFNVFERETPVLIRSLVSMFLCYEPEEFSMDRKKLANFLSAVAAAYADNPYHSFRHAFDVTQTLFVWVGMILRSHEDLFSHLEVFAMLVSALCHDVGHPGKTNKFLVATQDQLALLYNDKSVLEQMHCSKTFSLLMQPGCDLLAGLPRALYMQVRGHIVSCILATDMADHFSLQTKIDTVSTVAQLSTLDLMCVLVHSCDISNVTKSWELAYKWSTNVTTEFFLQGDVEKQMELPVEPHMDRTRSTVEKNTINFITYVCRKWFVALAKIFPLFAPLVTQMESNLEQLIHLSEKKEMETKQ